MPDDIKMKIQTLSNGAKPPKQDKWTWLGWLIVIAALGVAFAHNFGEMWIRWYPAWNHTGVSSIYQGVTGGESYYTHGPLVPLVSIIILLVLMKIIVIPVHPRPILGAVVLLAAAMLHIAACFARINFISGFAFIGILVGIVLALWGVQALRKIWFPLLFLVFMVPLPEVTIAQLNFRLKFLAADWGVNLVRLTGILVERVGNKVFLEGDKSLVIANVCNGLRTLISVMAFGAIYAYICTLKGLWKPVIFLMAIPVAVVSNALRIASLILVAHIWTVETATGWYHDFSGLMILVMAYLLMFGLEKVILWLYAICGKPVGRQPLFAGYRRDPGDHQKTRLLGAMRSPSGLIVVFVLIITSVIARQLQKQQPTIYDENTVKNVLPNQVQLMGCEWFGYDLELDKKSLIVLETEDAIYRSYVCPYQPEVDFCVVFSQDNRKGTHPPDLCLEGGGQ
ncbi:MAG: exosortase, partial [Sedimentisphaerales bacterium]|nr:exosortase [Sedimentisphaerales bacterium]